MHQFDVFGLLSELKKYTFLTSIGSNNICKIEIETIEKQNRLDKTRPVAQNITNRGYISTRFILYTNVYTHIAQTYISYEVFLKNKYIMWYWAYL